MTNNYIMLHFLMLVKCVQGRITKAWLLLVRSCSTKEVKGSYIITRMKF